MTSLEVAAPEIRPVRPEDLPALRALLRRIFEHDRPPGTTFLDYERALELLIARPELGAVAVEREELVGYVLPEHDALEIDPARRRRGHGRRLLAAGRAIAAAEGRAELELYVPPVEASEAFARSVGLRYRSSLHLLALPASHDVPEPVFPGSVAEREFRPGTDDEPLVRLMNATFVDHPSPMVFELDLVRLAHARPGFDPSDIRLIHAAADRDDLVGFCRATVVPLDEATVRARVDFIGVLPAWRSQGLGRELLRWGVAHVRAKGAGRVELVVEARNERALELYRRSGFEPQVEWPHWTIAARD